MDRFEELEQELVAVSETAKKLFLAGERSGFCRSGTVRRRVAAARELQAMIESLANALEVCLTGPITEEFLQETVQHYNQMILVLMAAIGAPGVH